MPDLEKRLFLMSRDCLVDLILKLNEIDGAGDVIETYLDEIQDMCSTTEDN